MSNTMAMAADEMMSLEGADVETTTDEAPAYDQGRDEIYETDLLDEDSDLDQDLVRDTDGGS